MSSLTGEAPGYSLSNDNWETNYRSSQVIFYDILTKGRPDGGKIRFPSPLQQLGDDESYCSSCFAGKDDEFVASIANNMGDLAIWSVTDDEGKRNDVIKL